MNLKTDFAKFLGTYFQEYLPHEKNVRANTQKAYRDVFVQFINYMKTTHKVPVEKLSLIHYTKKYVLDFLNMIVAEKNCSSSTRNQRLAAFKSFARYLQYIDIEHINMFQDIISIQPLKCDSPIINYLSVDGIKLLLSQPNNLIKNSKRHLMILSLMYETGARVQELCDLKVNSLRIENKPYTIRLFGKGGKGRTVPLSEEIVKLLKDYMEEYNLTNVNSLENPLFFNNRREKLTRAGITHILNTYITMARQENPNLIPTIFSCHCIRHSRAMHLLQAGVNLVYIRDILGHTQIKTTEVYAKADSKFKQEALEKAYIETLPTINSDKTWHDDKDLLAWLKNL